MSWVPEAGEETRMMDDGRGTRGREWDKSENRKKIRKD